MLSPAVSYALRPLLELILLLSGCVSVLFVPSPFGRLLFVIYSENLIENLTLSRNRPSEIYVRRWYMKRPIKVGHSPESCWSRGFG